MKSAFKSILAPLALVAALSGVWISMDAGLLALQPSAIEAYAGGTTPFQNSCTLPPSCSLHASPSSLSAPGNFTLSWDSTNTIGGEIDNGLGSLPGAAGYGTVYIPGTTTFHAQFWNSIGQYAYCLVTVTVTPPPPPAPTCTLSANPTSINQGDSSKLTWTTTNASSVSIDQSVGSVSANGNKNVSPSTTTTYTLTATGSGGTVHCTRKITVTPPPNGCIEIKKETYNTSGGILTPVAQFSFKLDGGATVQNDANGDAIFTNVTPGTHTVTEVNPGSTWTQLSVTPANGSVVVQAGPTCAAVVFKNKQVLPPPQNGCIKIKKQTLTTSGANLTPVAQFTFKLDGGATVQNDANGDAIFTNVTPGTHTVTEVSAGSTWNLIAQSPSNGVVTVASGSQCVTASFVNKQVVTNTPSCTLHASPTSINQGGSSTLAWTTSDITSATIDNGVGTTTPVASGSTSVSPSTTTTYTLTGTGPDGSVTCNTTVTVIPPTNPTPSCTLTASSTSIKPGDSITVSWTSANVTSGFIDNSVGTTTPVSSGTSAAIFPSSSTTYTGTFTGPYGTVQCTVPVHVTTSGCTENCGGGGYNQPSVALFQKPGTEPLAFVSLAQIPYTGFEAGPALTFIFWLAVAGLSAFIAYLIAGRGSMRYLLSYVVGGFMGMPVGMPYGSGQGSNREVQNHPYPRFNEENQFSVTEPVHVSAAPTSHPAWHQAYASVAPVMHAATGTPMPTLADVIESRAHAAGVLMSPEAVAAAAALSGDRAETLQMFGGILNDAVRTVPREDGWIMLTTDRLHALSVAQSARVSAPVRHSAAMSAPSTLDENAAVAFAGAVASSDRESAFSIIRSLEHDGVSPTALMTGTASVLDALYRARHDRRTPPNAALAEKVAHLSDEKLERLVAVFTHALDHVYASPFTGVKLALAQAFEALA